MQILILIIVGVREASFDPLSGFISPRQKGLLDKINNAVKKNTGYKAGLVTHHGPENQYPKSPYVDYPILVFEPVDPKNTKDGEAYLIRLGPPGFRDIHLKRFFTQKNRLGYNLWPNPKSKAWKWEGRRKFDLKRGYDPRDVSSLPAYVNEAPEPTIPVKPCKRHSIPAQHSCDEFAGDPLDNDRMGPAVKFFSMDTKKAISACQNALKEHPKTARFRFQLARAYTADEQYKKAFHYYKESAEQDYSAAQYNLGLMYLYGQGIPKDKKKAKYWYDKAASQGHKKAKEQDDSLVGNKNSLQ